MDGIGHINNAAAGYARAKSPNSNIAIRSNQEIFEKFGEEFVKMSDLQKRNIIENLAHGKISGNSDDSKLLQVFYKRCASLSKTDIKKLASGLNQIRSACLNQHSVEKAVKTPVLLKVGKLVGSIVAFGIKNPQMIYSGIAALAQFRSISENVHYFLTGLTPEQRLKYKDLKKILAGNDLGFFKKRVASKEVGKLDLLKKQSGAREVIAGFKDRFKSSEQKHKEDIAYKKQLNRAEIGKKILDMGTNGLVAGVKIFMDIGIKMIANKFGA